MRVHVVKKPNDGNAVGVASMLVDEFGDRVATCALGVDADALAADINAAHAARMAPKCPLCYESGVNILARRPDTKTAVCVDAKACQSRQEACPRCGCTKLINASQSMDCTKCGHSW